jgi:uncharacterized membrane protein (DUF485 family)
MNANEPTANASPPVSHDDHPVLVLANATLGLKLFAVYLVLYLGFVLGSAFAPEFMASTPFMGLNVAVIYGIGLIKAAFLLAVVYVLLCGRVSRRHADQVATSTASDGGSR